MSGSTEYGFCRTRNRPPKPMNAIVTTTINPPGACVEKHAQRSGWDLVVVGDRATPHEAYRSLSCIYLAPEDQEARYPELSRRIGWNCPERRTLGLAYAYEHDYEIVAVVDDDNIPYENWGVNLLVGTEASVELYETDLPVFEPLRELGFPALWHRGFPWEWLREREKQRPAGRGMRRVLVQADMWDGDPDVDAICRMIHAPSVKFQQFAPIASSALMPFNSQNTFLHRSVLPDYMMLTNVGRHHDIWASYLMQREHLDCVVYAPASVVQDRNAHDLAVDLGNEHGHYQYTKKLVSDLANMERVLSAKTLRDFRYYQKFMRSL